jgi:plastocyanin
MRTNRIVLLVFGICALIAGTSQVGCSSDGNSTGSGGSRGAAGAAGGSSGGAGGAPAAFMSFKPCEQESDYETGKTTIQFPDPDNGSFAYAPKCLKVTAGTSVTFSGSFTSHPLAKSSEGDANNPITDQSSGSSASVTFSTRGFYPYHCAFHGADGGIGMAGVVWVQ